MLLTALSFSILLLPVHGQVLTLQSVAATQPATSDVTPVETTRQTSPPEIENPVDPASLLPDLRPLSPAKASLLGGTVAKLDRVQDRIAVQVFGGGKVKVFFDPRTHIFSNGTPATIADLHQGDRVYIDTVLDGDKVFARTINLKNAVPAGSSQGMVMSYSAEKGELQVRDMLSPTPVRIQINSSTRIIRDDHSLDNHSSDNHAASVSDLVPGTLVALKFGSQKDGRGVAQEVAILAVPGSNFAFAGEVVGLDLSAARLVVSSITDHKTYEIYLDPASVHVVDDLHLGSQVSVMTNFDGSRYIARSLTVTK